MSDDPVNDPNPYASPATVEDPVTERAPRFTMVVAAVSVTAVCYVGVTGLLLSSGGIDLKAGKLLGFNVPVVLLWLLAVVRQRHFALVAGLATVFVQTVITANMLFKGIGDPAFVVAFNGVIITVLLFLVWLSQRSTGKQIQVISDDPYEATENPSVPKILTDQRRRSVVIYFVTMCVLAATWLMADGKHMEILLGAVCWAVLFSDTIWALVWPVTKPVDND